MPQANPKLRRGVGLLLIIMLMSLAAWLILDGLKSHVVFFYGPSELQQLAETQTGPNRQNRQRVRLGGLVAHGSVVARDSNNIIRFAITDGNQAIPVAFGGILPTLFAERQGVVTEGVLGADGVFYAERVLAKHDETYMPPEVVAILKQQGTWRGVEGVAYEEKP
ncbi:MAG: cytochrome c maturation protein CcmE [Proteobacteria bacterium]|nr:cytochrome c maturation protein CcmE [Pseudomonadota bacterium]